MLPDLLSNDLKLVICGTAAGTKSTIKQAYYAGPGNKFYKILFKAGLTSSLLNPSEYPKLLDYGIGLTDLVKCQSGMDHTLNKVNFDVLGFKAKIDKYEPVLVCFNGKESARVFMGLPSTSKIFYGLQEAFIGRSRLYVAPSTSGAANGHWDESYWLELKNLL